MGVFQTASSTFFSICSSLALFVSTITEWATYIIHVNYILVTNLYSSACYTLGLVYTTLNYIVQTVLTVLLYVFDFLAEIYACVCALLVLLWRICVLIYKLFCLFFTGIETLVLGLWNGGVLTYKAVHRSALDVVETCESTKDYIAIMVQDFVAYVCNFFTSIGSFATWLIRGAWFSIGYVPATIACIPSYFIQWVNNLWMRMTDWVSFAFIGVGRETYIGIGVCCLSYIIISQILHITRSRGFNLSSLRRRRRGRRNNVEAAPMMFDRGFESDLEEQEEAEENSSQEASDNNNSEVEEESDADSELTLSDGDSEDDASVSAGSVSDAASEESEHEIDVQLPTSGGGDHNNYSRCSTPCRNIGKDMSSDDFERALERERDKRKCVVCQDANKSVLIMPCKHMCLCVRCADQLVRSPWVGRRICPLCRRRIERVMNVYV